MKALKLCFKDNILRNNHFLGEITFNDIFFVIMNLDFSWYKTLKSDVPYCELRCNVR